MFNTNYGCIPLAAVSFLLFAGCSLPPQNAAWKSEEKVIQPEGSEARGPGSLVVETVLLGTDNGDELHRAFFLYDEQGRYLTHHPNRTPSPVTLSAGGYVVVSSILNTNKRVQVVIKEGQTTFVRLSDFKSAPEAQ